MKKSKVFPFQTNRADLFVRNAADNVQRIFDNQKKLSLLQKFQKHAKNVDDISLSRRGSSNNNNNSSDSTFQTNPSYDGDHQDDNYVDFDDDDNDEVVNNDDNVVQFTNESLFDSLSSSNPVETMDTLKHSFQTLSRQIQDFRQKLVKSAEKIHDIEKEKATLEDQKYNLEEENLLLRQNLVDSMETRKKQQQPSEIQHILNDIMKKKRYRTSLNNDHHVDKNDLLVKASLRAYDDVDEFISYRDIFKQTNHMIQYLKILYKKILPFQHDIRQIEGRLGSSVASYFIFQRFLFVQFMIIAMFMLTFGTYHIYNTITHGNISYLYTFQGMQPAIMLYSSFDPSESVFYAWSLVGTVFLCVIIGIFKLVREDRLKKTVDSLEKENSNPFASEILCSWEFSYSNKDEINDYSASLSHVYNQLLDDAFAHGMKSKRTKKDEYILLGRRIIGFTSYFMFQMIAIAIIIFLNIQSELIKSYFGIFSPVVLSLSLSMINSFTPTFLQFITKFEKWDYAETEVNLLLIRMYLSTSLNLIIVVLSYLLLANPVWISYYSYLANLQIIFEPDSYNCRLDQVSSGIFVLVISNFVLRQVSVFARGYMNANIEVILPSYKLAKPQFELADSLVGLLDLIGIAFLLFPFNPLSIILLPIFFYLQIKWERYVMLKYYNKPKRPWKSQKARQIFAYVYLSTITIIAIPLTIAFLAFKTLPKSCDIQDNYIHMCLDDVILDGDGTYICTVDQYSKYYDDFGDGIGKDAYPNNICSSSCGAFVDASSPFAPLRDSIMSTTALSTIYTILFEHPYFPWLLAIMFIVYIATEKNTINVKKESHETIEKVLETKILTLQAENIKQSKIIARLKAVESKDLG